MGEAVAQRGRGRHHPHHLRRSVPCGYQGLSRAEARRHRHHAGVSAVAAADPAAGACDDRERAGSLSRHRRSEKAAGGICRDANSMRNCWPICLTASTPAARTASFTPAWWRGRCSRGGLRLRPASASSAMAMRYCDLVMEEIRRRGQRRACTVPTIAAPVNGGHACGERRVQSALCPPSSRNGHARSRTMTLYRSTPSSAGRPMMTAAAIRA